MLITIRNRTRLITYLFKQNLNLKHTVFLLYIYLVSFLFILLDQEILTYYILERVSKPKLTGKNVNILIGVYMLRYKDVYYLI